MIAPILFSAPLVRAILAGEKTQTRRLPKVRVQHRTHGGGVSYRTARGEVRVADPWHKPLGAHPPGTLLWVRETTRLHLTDGRRFDEHGYSRDKPVEVEYLADGERRVVMPAPTWRVPGVAFKGQPLVSIHMPAWAARIVLRVTAVRLERLQAITDDDICAEGLPGAWSTRPGETLREQWARGWDAINGDRHREHRPTRWDADPWVIAYTFECVVPLEAGERVRFCERPTALADLGTLYLDGGLLHVRWDLPDGEECDRIEPLTGDIIGGIEGRVERVEVVE